MTVPAFRSFALLVFFGSVPAGHCLAQGASATATERFQALDANQDDFLSKYEYDSDTAIAAMDGDHNGRISNEELQAFIGSEQEGAASAADRIVSSDLDNDGELSDDELLRSLEFRFQWLDKDKDGNVDLAEYSAGMGIPMVGGK